MNFRRRPRLTGREIGILAVIGLASMIVLATLAGADLRLSRQLGGGGGFFAPWVAVRSFIFQQTNPYGGAVVAQTQELTYGRQAQAGENPHILVVPFFLLPFYLPLALISDAATARGIWLLLGQGAVIAATFISLGLTGWKPPPLFLVGFSLMSVFGLYAVLALVDGTTAVMLALVYVTILWAYAAESDELAGALTVLALFSWETGVVFLILFIARVLHDKRWRVLGGLGMTLTVLFVISFLIYPQWLLPFFTAVLGTARASFGLSTGEILRRISPLYGGQIAQAVSALLIVLLIYEWAAGRTSGLRRYFWSSSLALAVTPLLGLRSELSNLVVLLPALSLISAAAMARGRPHAWLALFITAIVFLVPWILLATAVSRPIPRLSDYLYLFYPLICILGLYWTRWWFLRPRGTWLDEARSARV